MTHPLKRLLQGAGFSVAALAVGIIFGLFLTPYLVRALGEASYGVYTLASLFAGWCGLLDFGLTTTTSRYVTSFFTRRDFRGLNEIGSTAIILFGGISALVLLLACCAFGLAALYGDSFDETGALGAALFFSGASFAVSKISDGVLGIVKGSLRQDLTGGAVFIFRVLFGVVNFAVLYFGGRVIALCVGNFILTFAQLLAYVVILRRSSPFFHFSLRSFRRARVRTLFSYSFFTFLTQAGEIAVNRSDLLVISALMTLSDVGRYNLVVVTLVSYFHSFLSEASSWETNWFARLSASGREPGVTRYSEEFYRSRSVILRVSTYFAVFIAFGLLAFGRAFIERWIGADYLATFPALIVCVVALGLYRGASEVNARTLLGIARHRILGYGAIIHGVLNIVLSVLFVKLGLGLVGVALGAAVPGAAIHLLWIPNATCRICGERRRAYWRAQLTALSIAASALLVPALCVRLWVAPEYFRIAALAILSLGLYVVVVFRFGFDLSERRRALELVRASFRNFSRRVK